MTDDQVNSLLTKLLPTYLARRNQDLVNLTHAVATQDFGVIQTIGHKLAGNASTYGFDELSQIGVELESAANSKDLTKIELLVQSMAKYLAVIAARKS